MCNIEKDHPRRSLLFFIEGEVDARIRSGVLDLIITLKKARKWVIAPPQLVDQQDNRAASEENDLPIVTLGGVLELYTALPPWKLPYHTELRHLDEVAELIYIASDFSRKYSANVVFELDQDCIGGIEAGEIDESLLEGLIGEWRRSLEKESGA